ncbi:ABC-type branched-chain amino acid transport system, periplasmic component [Halovivax ruber XH-70]|uniref:ABC-type branched-chain amino acid transport system, periplasmic component n=1 Tax=Halovivax ruber (strain DSM 18193 / JCM 13892 / XH-70) TaxID=797302 RepID=L0IFL7_HALRX|nr:ABC transporter substrate-binding protein [Halovivax ruber]AGB17016.1 ABC-type branched-chain amino acid transport system, periplasmic component [Halovivax ruber XH-70]
MPRDITNHRRRSVLKAAGVAGVSALAGCVGDPDEVDDGDDENFDTVQFGVLEPFTGDFADLAEERNQGERLAIEQINASDEFDFEIEYEEYDTQLNAEDGIQAANQAIERDGAQFLTGAISSSVALAINGIAEQNEVIYTPGAADTSITGQECNEYVFRFETSTAQIAEVMAQWTAENLGSSIMYSLADYAYGESVGEEFGSRMQEQTDDYEEVLTVEPAESATDFEAFITQLSDNAADADALVVGATGGHLIRFLLQAYERGLHEEIPIVTTTGSFAVVRGGATEAAQGIYSGTRYVPGLETGTNQQFVSDYEAEYDAQPDNFSRVGYGSIMMVAQGIQEAGSRDPSVVRETLSGMTYESIFGDVTLRECDQQATNPVWMAENVAPSGGGEVADVDLLTELDGEEAAPACEDTGCTL